MLVSADTCVAGCIPYKECTVADAGLNAEVTYFQLHEVEIPGELNMRYLQSIVLQEADQTEQLQQDSQISRKETELLVRASGSAQTRRAIVSVIILIELKQLRM